MNDRPDPFATTQPIKKSPKAFTLVELLVVIAVVGGLAALMVPAVKGGIHAAKSAKTVSHLKQTGGILINYASENNNRLPNSKDDAVFNAGGARFFQGDVSFYAGIKYDFSKNYPFADMFYDPCLAQSVQHPWGSFGVNESILSQGSEGVLITRISSPASKVIYCSASGGATSFKTSWIFTGTDFANQGMSAGIYCPDPRNRGKAASLFLDGHVELLDVKNMDQATRRKYFTLDP